jgi:hypothetical protein
MILDKILFIYNIYSSNLKLTTIVTLFFFVHFLFVDTRSTGTIESEFSRNFALLEFLEMSLHLTHC